MEKITGEIQTENKADGGQELKDISLRCLDCGRDFLFTTGEQVFYHDKKFQQPKHCPSCRRKRQGRDR